MPSTRLTPLARGTASKGFHDIPGACAKPMLRPPSGSFLEDRNEAVELSAPEAGAHSCCCEECFLVVGADEKSETDWSEPPPDGQRAIGLRHASPHPIR